MLMEEDIEKLKEIFSLLVDSTEVTRVPVNYSFPQHPTHIQLCDRLVTQDVLVKYLGTTVRKPQPTSNPLPWGRASSNPMVEYCELYK